MRMEFFLNHNKTLVFLASLFFASPAISRDILPLEAGQLCGMISASGAATGENARIEQPESGLSIIVEDGTAYLFEKNGDLIAETTELSYEDKQQCILNLTSARAPEASREVPRIRKTELATPYLFDVVDGNSIATANFCASGQQGASAQSMVEEGFQRLRESGDQRMLELAENLQTFADTLLNETLPGADLGELTATDCTEVNICSLGDSVAVELQEEEQVVTYNNVRYVRLKVLQGPCRDRVGYVSQEYINYGG